MIIGFCVDNTGLGKPINYTITKNNKNSKPKIIKYSKLLLDNAGFTPFDIIDEALSEKEDTETDEFKEDICKK